MALLAAQANGEATYYLGVQDFVFRCSFPALFEEGKCASIQHSFETGNDMYFAPAVGFNLDSLISKSSDSLCTAELILHDVPSLSCF